ncbi:hypothetical protein PINS_up010489 [Pythium insidiosum]|nr:hypothetical protein PINS_up010489 [Pythium insidiosum]
MAMEFGAENATRLMWRSQPELLINEESLVDIITKLRGQVQALEKNELLSGTALPPWLLKALTDVANNVDAVVECQALHEQVTALQKEVLELRHELLVQQSAVSTSTNSTTSSFSPTPHHRLSTSGSRTARRSPSLTAPPRTLGPIRAESQENVNVEDAVNATMAALGTPATEVTMLPPLNLDSALKPLWDAIHKQTNEFSGLRDAFHDAKDTVARLQSEIKRRDAVVQARNAKHESTVQTQLDKLNESLRACVTRNDLISAEQRIAQQMKLDRQRVMEDVENRSNKIVDDLLASRADQEDINSANAETLQHLTRKQIRLEDQVVELMRKFTDGQQNINDMRGILSDAVAKVDANSATIDEFQLKVHSFEETQATVRQITEDMKQASETNESMRAELEERLIEKIGESATMIRGELHAVNAVVSELVELNIDQELKSLSAKLDVVQLNTTDCTRKITSVQKQVNTNEEQSRTQFTQVFDSIDRVQSNMSTLSEESMRLAYTLAQTIEHGNSLQRELNDHKALSETQFNALYRSTAELDAGLEKHIKATESEMTVVKDQLFHVEDITSTLKREIETTQQEVESNLRTQTQENQETHAALDTLFIARDDLNARQDAAQAQMMALQAENRAEIQSATAKLIAIVDKESDRVEALYASFQERQEHFADVVARSSIRNMDLTDMNREMDRICESFVQECWKFETSARSSNKASSRLSDNNNNNNNSVAAARKLFNERQQQLLTKNCQFIADLIVARAEYEVLHTGCNKDVKNQVSLDDLMLDAQDSIVEKVKVKIQTKIMNNKNIGEQFDKSTLDRRELYLETVANMIEASMKRRTLLSGSSGGRGDANDRYYREDPARASILSVNASFLETQRLTTSTSGGNSIRRKSSSRRTPLSFTPTGLGSDLDSSRSAFTPGSSYVYRAGFRLPKAAAQSPPNSPEAVLRRGTVLSTPGTSDAADNAVLISTPFAEEDGDVAAGEDLQGWGGEDKSMTKSISLPALRQA